MSSIVKKAVLGQKNAMLHLYEMNVGKVFYIAKALFCDEKKAEDATIAVFGLIWMNVNTATEITEEDFATILLDQTIQYCKKKILKENPKAYRIPSGKNFQVTNIEQMSVTEELDAYILGRLPDLQRLILALRVICKYDNERIARELKFKPNVVNLALEAEENNINRIIRTACMEDSFTYSDIIVHLEKNELEIVVPETIRTKVELYVNERAKPYEKKIKKKCLILTLLIGLFCTLLGAGLWYVGSKDDAATVLEENTNTENVEQTENTEVTQASSFDESLTYYADINIENYGMITVELDQSAAPVTVENFVSLAENGFYDGLTFHRIIEDFMMQGGDPNGDGTGGSEETITGEFLDNGYDNNLSHTRGAIAMARSSEYDSASSQFFILHEDSTHLDGQYAVFGYVIEGMDIVDAICESAKPTDDNGTIESSEQPIIESITIRTE